MNSNHHNDNSNNNHHHHHHHHHCNIMGARTESLVNAMAERAPAALQGLSAAGLAKIAWAFAKADSAREPVMIITTSIIHTKY